MDLYIHHGRKSPDEHLDDWGPDGPRLKNVTGIHQTYGNSPRVFFETEDAADTAQTITGWRRWDSNALEMVWHEEFVVVFGVYDQRPMYCGDWGLMP